MMETKIVEYLEAFEAVIARFGPQAADFALFYVRLDSGIRAFGGLALLLIAYLIAYAAIYGYKAGPKDGWGEPSAVTFMGVVMAGILAGGVAVGGVVYGLNPWNWIGMFAPQLKLVHDAIQVVR